MEANELRIGNLVNTISRSGKVHLPVNIPFYVAGIEQGKIKGFVNGTPIHQVVKYHDLLIRDLEPIPITEEWLLRLGFTKGKDKYLSPYKNSENGHWDRMVYYLHEREFIVNSNEYDGWDVPCEFVHQLQNIYFALTGEELKLNEK